PDPEPRVQERVIIREREVHRPAAPRIDPYEREQARSVQIALNYFGFDAGAPDGIKGRRTRAAIREYQAFMGFPVTGNLAEYGGSFLVSSHARALAGGPQTIQIVAAQGTGSRGLLKYYQQDDAAGGVANAAAASAPVAAQPAPPPEVETVAATAEPEAGP